MQEMASLLRKLLEIEVNDEHKDRASIWRASSLGKCKRIQILEALGFREINDPQRKLVMKMGSAIHEIVQEMLSQSFPAAKFEIPLNNDEINIGGTVDVIIPIEEQ